MGKILRTKLRPSMDKKVEGIQGCRRSVCVWTEEAIGRVLTVLTSEARVRVLTRFVFGKAENQQFEVRTDTDNPDEQTWCAASVDSARQEEVTSRLID